MGIEESVSFFISLSLLTSTSWPSVAKFINIMSSNSARVLLKLAKFIKSANTVRSQALSAIALSALALSALAVS